MMTDVTKKLCLKVAQIKETGTNTIKEIAGSPEVKGVRGTDKRKYIIDLMRLHPRDVNYISSELDSAAVNRE
jgi:hypothetical protein